MATAPSPYNKTSMTTSKHEERLHFERTPHSRETVLTSTPARSVTMGPVTAGPGKHAGARTVERPEPVPHGARSGRGALLALALGTTLCLVAWGYLVWAAIDFGRKARGG